MHGFDLRQLLRGGGSDARIARAVARAWGARADRYSEMRSERSLALPRVEMSYIGG